MGTFATQIQIESDNEIVNQHALVSLAVSDAQWEPQGYCASYKTGYENRSCVWSTDASYIAWSCGHGRIKVVPWNSVKNCLLSDDDTNLDGTPLKHDRLIRTFEAGSQVYCLAFGSKSSGSAPNRSTRYRYRVVSDGLILAAGLKDGRIRVWNIKTGDTFLVLMDHTGAVQGIRFSPDGSLRLLSASLDGSLKIWDIEDDGNMSHTFRSKVNQGLMACTWSPDARLVCGVGHPRSVQVWDVESRTCRQFRGHLNTVCSCSFSKDGFFLVTASYDTRVIIWNVCTGGIIRRLCHLYPPPKEWLLGGCNNSHIRDLSLSPNGHHVVTVCDDSVVRVWDILSANAVQEVALVSEALSCTYSPGGACIAVGKADGSLQIFEAPMLDVSLQSLCRFAIQDHLKRCSYTPEQKQLLFNTLPPALQAFINYESVISLGEHES